MSTGERVCVGELTLWHPDRFRQATLDQTGDRQFLRGDLTLEAGELADIDHLVLDTEHVVETPLRDAAHQ